MTEFKTVCPECGQRLTMPNEMAGETIKCPACEVQITLPTLPSGTPPNPLAEPGSPTEQPKEPASGSTQPEPAAKPKCGLRKGLLYAATAAAGEAKRGAQIAKFKAQIEKLQRVDLRKAYRDLGKVAYKIRYVPESYEEQYAAIESLKARIDEKRAGIETEPHDTVATKVKAAAASTKMKAEAEALVQKLNGLFVDLGELIRNSPVEAGDLAEANGAVQSVVDRIAALRVSCENAVADMSSRKQISEAANTISTEISDVASSVVGRARRFNWKSKPIIIGAACVLLIAIAVLAIPKRKNSMSRGQDSGSRSGTSTSRSRSGTSTSRSRSGSSARSGSSRRSSSSRTSTTSTWLRERAGKLYTFKVLQILDEDDYAGICTYGGGMYEIMVWYVHDKPMTREQCKKYFPQISNRDSPQGRAILVTKEGSFTSTGTALLSARRVDTIKVTMNDGGTVETAVYEEARTEDILAYQRVLKKNEVFFNLLQQSDFEALKVYLSDNNVDMACENESAMTPLLFVIHRQKIKATKFLVEKGADINHPSSEGKYPLLEAVRWFGENTKTMIDWLVAHGGDPKIRDSDGKGILIKAVEARKYDLAKRALQKGWGQPDEKTADGKTLVYKAIRSSPDVLLPALVKAGLKINGSDSKGITPLHIAAEQGSDMAARHLLNAGAKIDPRSNDGLTPLCVAASKGSPTTVELLCKKGANVNFQTPRGMTPLMFAASQHDGDETIPILVNAGARLELTDKDGMTALHHALKEALEGWTDNTRALLVAGADVNAKDSQGNTPLHIAAEITFNTDIISLLLEKGAKKNVKNKAGLTPYLIAASKGSRTSKLLKESKKGSPITD